MTYPARHVLSVGVVLALATGAWSIGNSGTSQQAQQVEAVAPSLEQMNAPSPSMAFEPNHGQTGPHVDYVSRGEGYGLLLSPTEAVFSLRPAAAAPAPGEGRARNERPAPTVLRMSLVDGNPAAPHVAAERLPGASHYLTGSDPANWRRNVPRYGRVEYKSVYDGIDLVYYGNQGQLEYDFVVAPGKDPGRIALEFSGISSLDLDEAGNLVLGTEHGNLKQHKPVVYQWVDGARRAVEGAYALLAGNRVGFSLGDYDVRLPLVIDPVLSYSTFLGGDGWDSTAAIAVDGAGNTYVAGNTNSIEFAWDMGNDSEFSGVYDAYVCRFKAVGSMPYCAYVGGSGDDAAWGLAVGPNGNAYVTGYTDSFDFPVLRANQPSRAAGTYGDAFLFKINNRGDDLEYSTYYGGNDSDVARGVVVDSRGSAYITGNTYSWEGFPVTADAMQRTDPAGVDAFVAKFLDSGALAYSTYLGGGAADQGRGIALDAAGGIWVSGMTDSADFPTRGAIQAAHAGGGDAFLVKLDAAGKLRYGTYLGGSATEWGYGVQVDRAGNIHLAGITSSTDFPATSNALQAANKGGQDGFLARFKSNGSLAYATYYGGSDMDDMRHIALDPAGNVYWTGYTSSPDFPLFNPLQPKMGGSQDQVLVQLDASGRKLLRSTSFGGSGWEIGSGIALGRDGTIHLTGYTASTDLPLYAPFQKAHGSPAPQYDGVPDIYLTRLTDASLRSWPGDFDGNGTSDLLWRNQATGAGSIWPGAVRSQARDITRVTDLDWQIVGVGDFDGDGRDDILWRHVVTGANTVWRRGNYSNAMGVTSVTDTNWKVVGTGDFNGDGKDDILWRNAVTGANAIWNAANYNTQISVTNVTGLAWEVVGVADFDGDSRDDILWRDTSSGKGTIWKQGKYASQQAVDAVKGTAWKVVGLGDFDGDGKDDILWRNGVNGQNLIWRSGLNGSRLSVAGVTNHDWQVLGTGDYDGDGRSDILWRNHYSGANTIWRRANSKNQLGVVSVTDQNWIPKS
ncbi:SBBP repeat-containing protein [Luteimonas composti]|uniref:SBBP repeat-containing protein n=1 Tax=Luteimonas composti TaxID=398257 RepID=A0ABT6MTI2_9GAMM|nr:SBBP repeat-containing protein [Luteimonas composti]MDH7453927.1 SBBP repeat-containing protein [Luteimonas composti]